VLQLQCIWTYGKELQKTKEKKETKKYYKYNKVAHLTKNCRSGQKIKNGSIQEESDDEDKEDNNKKKGFVRGLK